MPGRKILSNKLFGLLALFFFLPIPPAAASLESDFMAAREAYAAGNSSRLDLYAKKLSGSDLEMYPLYWQLRMRLETADPGVADAFFARYDGTQLADQLRKEWLRSAGKKQNWTLIKRLYPPIVSKTTDITCLWIDARRKTGETAALLDAKQIWFAEKDFPDSCLPLFSALIEQGSIGDKDIRVKLRYALSEGSLSLFRQINRLLPSSEALKERAVEAAYADPYRYLDHAADDVSSAKEREVVMFAVARIARSAPEQAYSWWLKLSEKIPAADRRYLIGQIARKAAMAHYPGALHWFALAGDNLSDGDLEWEVRAALRARDWASVTAAIDAMSKEAAGQESWRYWRARALQAAGKTADANAIFAVLSHRYDYYGQLSLEELGTTVSIPPDGYKPSVAEIDKAEKIPGIRRSLLLYRMNLRIEAAREWDWAIRGLDDRTLLATAELARREHLYDRTIYSAEKTASLHDFSLRYLAPYREIMTEQAKEMNLDEAWVYGLIRQESRFITVAHSSVGASGLMQLMPATARWVARKMGLKNFRQSLTHDLSVNISLGTFYLKHMLNLFDNQPVLASAAYNAGPVRARQWMDDKPMEGAIYAETIPFLETRDYVKKVMSNTEYYASSFGEAMRPLKERLGVIARNPNHEQSLAGEP